MRIINKILRIRDRVYVLLFKIYDKIFCSSFYIRYFDRKTSAKKSDRRISVAITSFHREEFIMKSLKNILRDDRVEEIVILDDGSSKSSFESTKKILNNLSNKIKLYRREENLGSLTTKIQAISLCKNDWVIILDSDNTCSRTYVDTLNKIANWDSDTVYAPSFAYPYFDYRVFSGVSFDFAKVRQYLTSHTRITMHLLNTGNFFVNRKKFVNLMEKYEFFHVSASDGIFFNYLWLSGGGKINVVPDCKYFHRVHRESTWTRTEEQSTPLVDFLKHKIVAGEKAEYDKLVERMSPVDKETGEIFLHKTT